MEKIDNFEISPDIKYGTVLSLNGMTAKVSFQYDAIIGELIEFDQGARGVIVSIGDSHLDVHIYGCFERLIAGSTYERLCVLLETPLGD